MRVNWRGNWTYKIIAVVLALGLWLYVSEERYPVGENVLNVPLETRDLPSGLAVAEKPAEVVVRVQGEREMVNRLTARDIQAFVSLGGVQLGKNICAVQVVLPVRVDLVQVSPAQATLAVEEVARKQVPVEVRVISLPAPGYSLLQTIVHPEEVVVWGPQGWLNRIAKGFVEVNMADRDGSLRAYLPVRLVEKDGTEATGTATELDPAVVEVFVPVVPAGPSKVVPVKVPLKGTPAAGYKVGRVVVSPTTIRVYGSQEALAQLSSLSCRSVDVSGAESSIEATLEFSLSEELSLEPVAVQAVIEIVPGTG